MQIHVRPHFRALKYDPNTVLRVFFSKSRLYRSPFMFIIDLYSWFSNRLFIFGGNEYLTRLNLGISHDVNHSTALHALGWEPLETERKKAKTKTMYKLLNHMGPKSLTNLFSYKNEKINYNLNWDISSDLSLPKPRTNNIKNSFMYM